MKNKTKHYSLGKLEHLTAAAVIGLISGYSPETLAVTPTIFMQSATINSAANAVTLTRVPVKNAAGTILYKDISMLFAVDTLGNVTLPAALVKITPSPTINVGAFKPGTYKGFISSCTYDNGSTFKVGSPGVGAGGRISGSIQRVTTDSVDTFNANWTSGPITGHPDQAKLNAAKITSTAFNWGVVGNTGCSNSDLWQAGDIIGVVQNGNQLSLVNYGIDNISDRSLTFTLCPTANPC